MTNTAPYRNPVRPYAYGLLALLPFLLFAEQLEAGWRFDDPHHLAFLSGYRHFEYFYDFGVARLQSGAHFTPFNIWTYDIAGRFFPVGQPAGFYAFHLVLIGLAAALLCRFLEPRRGLGAAWVAALVFLAGFPVAAISGQLMVGHYVTGLCFALLCLITFRPEDARVSWLSVVFYFLACLSKEVYVPLICVLALQARQRPLAKLVPYGVVLLLFLGCRYLVIGQLVGGYSEKGPLAKVVLPLLGGLLGLFRQSVAHGVLLAGAAAGAWVLWREQSRRQGAGSALPGALLVAAGVLGPLLAVYRQVGVHAPGDVRLLLVVWVVFACCCAALLQALGGGAGRARVAAAVVALGLIASAAVTGRQVLHDGALAQLNRQFDRFSEYVTQGYACHLVDSEHGWSSWAHDLQRVAAHPDMAWRRVASAPLLDVLVPDHAPVCRIEGGRIVEAGHTTTRACAPGAQVSGRFWYDGANLHARFGPEANATYHLEVPGQYVLRVPSRFYGPLPQVDRFKDFRVYRVLDDGAIACSPALQFDPEDEPELTWGAHPEG